MKAGAVLRLMASAFALALSACGGGGGGSDAPATRPALPQLTSDAYPAGERLDLQSRNYFPAAAGDSWVYTLSSNGAPTGQTVTRTVTGATADTFTISETNPGTLPETESYRRTSAGISQLDLTSDLPSAVQALVGEVMMFPEPFYPVGGTRSAVRQGSWGEDADGDGIVDSFRFELSQQLVGFETVALPLGSPEAARFRTVITLTISPSSLRNAPVTISGTEESWWAPDIGLVRVDRTLVDENGATSTQSLAIASGSVGGTALFTAQPDGTLIKLALTHNALVFDASRNRYYASIPGSAGSNGNSIATIDATTGAVSHSAAVGSEPFPMAVAPDGSALYVGLKGSGEVVKLTLPAMSEQYRVRLPGALNSGTQLLPKSIAVSPVESDVIAVSTVDPVGSSYNSGAVQIRAAAVQPQIVGGLFSSGVFASIGPLAYDGNGATVYGYDDDTTGFSLHALSVLGNGLSLTTRVGIDMGFNIRTVDWTPQGIVVHRGVYRSSDLALLGTVTPNHCRAHSVANRMVCIAGSGRLALIDMGSFVTVGSPAFSVDAYPPTPDQLVPGTAGQVAMRFGSTYISQPATDLWLFTSPQLQ